MNLVFNEIEKIKVIGNIHINNMKSYIDSLDITDTMIIACGDYHIGFDTFNNDVEKILKIEYQLEKNNNYLMLIRGNRDNPKYFKKGSSFKEELIECANNIYAIDDYSIIKTKNHNILCIGGAKTLDTFHTISIWPNEMVKRPDNNFYETLEANKVYPDIIISHTAPLFAYPLEFNKDGNPIVLNAFSQYNKTLKNDIYKERLLLKGIYEKLCIKNHIKYYIYSHFEKSNKMKYNKTELISLKNKESFDIN